MNCNRPFIRLIPSNISGESTMSKRTNEIINARLCRLTSDVTSSFIGAVFICVLDGSVDITVNSKNSTLSKEDIIYLSPETIFSIEVKSPVLLIVSVFHPCFLLENLGYNWDQICTNATFDKSKAKEFISNLAVLTLENSKDHSNFILAKAYEVLHILESINSNNKSKISANSSDVQITILENYLQEHYCDDISLTDAAKDLDYTPQYLANLIKKKLHQTFHEYLTSCRLDAASLYIKYTDCSISRIYSNCGFSNQSAFLQAFEQRYGYSLKNLKSSNNLPDIFAFPNGFDVITSSNLSRDYLFNYINYNFNNLENNNSLSVENSISIIANTQESSDINLHSNEIVNLGSAFDFDNSEFLNHIKNFHDTSLVKYGRISESILTISSYDIGNQKIYDFTRAFYILDFLKSINILPFLELGNKPFNIYKLREFEILNYNISSTDKAYDENLENLLPEFLKACISRYGYQEVSKWKLELWRRYSPNLENIEPANDYAKRFSRLSAKIKSIIPEMQFGGFGFNTFLAFEILKEQIEVFKDSHLSPDFFTAYYFPYTYSNNARQARKDKNVAYHISESIQDMSIKVRYIRKLLDESNLEQTPLYITEYSAFISENNMLNDTVYPALFIIYQSLANYESASGLAYWLTSDLSLENGNNTSLLFGGNGLVSKDGLFKPSCFAYTLLDMLGKKLIAKSENYIITKQDDGSIQILLYYIGKLDSNFANSPTEHNLLIYPYSPFAKQPPKSFNIELSGIHYGYHKVKEYRLSMELGSVINSWKNLSYSTDLEKSDLEYIRSNSYPYQTQREEFISGNFSLHETLNPNETVMYVLKPSYRHYDEFKEGDE